MLVLALACSKPSTTTTTAPTSEPAGSDATLAHLDLGAALTPAFDPDRSWYAVRALDLADPIPVEAVPSDPAATVAIRVEHVDGDDVDGLPAKGDHRLVVEVTSADGAVTGTTAVSLLPGDFPEITVDRPGEPSPGWTLLADYDFVAQPAGIGRFLMAVDDAGVPGWWRRTTDPSFDLRATGGGGLSWVGSASGGLAGFAVDGSYEVVAERVPVLVEDFVAVSGDPHEFAVQDDGTCWLVGAAFRTEDLSAWGYGSAVTVLHNVVQHLDPDGGLLSSWSTAGVVDYGALPPAVWGTIAAGGFFEPAHVNSVEVDPADGDLVISMRLPSRVVKVDAADGTLLWSLGGPASDFAFVDDDRENGWQGFSEQHSARMTGPDRLAVFDNGTSALYGRTGPARMAEYALDLDAWTATLVAEHALPGGEPTAAGGSVQRLADGGTLVGWGSLQVAEGGKAPAFTELDADGNVVLELTLAENLWTYRAWKADGDPLTGRFEAN